MSLTGAMLTGFTGISANSMGIATVGNNLANINTTAFKGQRTLFETLLYQTVNEGEAPSGTSGGTLPRQSGTGTQVSSIQRDFRQGSFESTGFQSDLAIDGEGFFILDGPAGQQLYTRDGSFHLDETQTLVSANGTAVQVFPVTARAASRSDRCRTSSFPWARRTRPSRPHRCFLMADSTLQPGLRLLGRC